VDINEVFDKAKQTFADRNKTYGDSYKEHGLVMGSLFPNGVTLLTDEDFIRYGLLNSMMTKIKRYTNSFGTPHADSTLDLSVYAAMLHEIDLNIVEHDRITNILMESIRHTLGIKKGESVALHPEEVVGTATDNIEKGQMVNIVDGMVMPVPAVLHPDDSSMPITDDTPILKPVPEGAAPPFPFELNLDVPPTEDLTVQSESLPMDHPDRVLEPYTMEEIRKIQDTPLLKVPEPEEPVDLEG
jgi:hypothetical protein